MNDKKKALWVKEPDLVEVVRCKDCINCSTIKSKITRDIYWFCDYYDNRKIHPMGFCCYGERKDNG